MTARAWASAVVAVVVLLPVSGRAAVPNDPGYEQQWGLQKMRSAQSWATSRGAGVVVAVIDTGVDASHPDLKGRVLAGRDFVDDDADASDAKGHGTHVAGSIAATAGNGIGIASVAPAAKVLPVRVLGPNGEGDPGDVAEGIRWAVRHGARVVNLSLAQDEALPVAGDTLLSDSRVDDAIEDAARSGSVVVVAAGNNDEGGRARTSYDSDVAGVLVVGATTKEDRRAAYANYGSGLDVVAPGGGSATDAKSCTPDNWIVSTWWNPSTKRSDYGGGCGTSMAVAHVSGLAALLLARGYSAAGTARRIVETATDLELPGRDDLTGAGRVDAARAVGPPGQPPAKATARPTAASQGSIEPTPARTPLRSPRPDPEPVPEPQATGAGRPVAAGDRGPVPASRSAPIAVGSMLVAALAAMHVSRMRRPFRGSSASQSRS